ncbi:MAG TPA: serine hydrolase [Candidatus Fimadaptatus faecigallinarum]|uniref:Serine hydrolase n=1 Tax=Candidatus Fimadaptatus faecigallinarum TaxID=2840814 RepID=A0A9D1S4H8_9FIRM|nr:serine hydrolase [Candidatus Fimadaptatus faecigallinarum]
MDMTRFEARAAELRVLGVKVTQDGRELAYRVWDDDCRRNIYSASKSFTSCAVGIAIREGLLSLDERLTDAFAADMPDEVSENLRRATVRDLLTMCLGQSRPMLMGSQRPLYAEDDWVRLALSASFDYMPGTRFVYNNVGPYLAGILVQRRAGCDLTAYLTPRLFKPLGIRRPTWESDPMGNTFGAGGLFLTLSEFHRFGLLYLNGGNWDGWQLVPAEWVRESGSRQSASDYGYLFWLGEHGSYRADGKYGQMSMIFGDRRAVITVTAECRDVDALRRAIYDLLYPQL